MERCVQRKQRFSNLFAARVQLWLLLPQLGEQRLDADAEVGNSQVAHALEKCLNHCHHQIDLNLDPATAQS